MARIKKTGIYRMMYNRIIKQFLDLKRPNIRILFVSFCVTFVSASQISFAEIKTDSVYTDMSGPELQELLQKWGFRAELGVDDTGDPEITSSVSGAKFVVQFYDCDQATPKRCASIAPSSAFDLDEGLTAAYINDWNRTNRFGTAWIDSEGDPFLDLHIDLTGGISAEGIRGFFDWWERSLGGYLDYIGW